MRDPRLRVQKLIPEIGPLDSLHIATPIFTSELYLLGFASLPAPTGH